jgi:predicted amidohydrolase
VVPRRCARGASPGHSILRRWLTDQSIHGWEGAPIRVAAVQLNSTPDQARNLEAADRLTRAAAAAGATLIVLPEKWPALGTPADAHAAKQPLDGPALTWARGLARELGIDLVAGSIVEQAGEHAHNTSVHIGPDGADRATYRKIHLFDVEVGGRTYRESDLEAPGADVVLSEAGGVQLGLTVCYDLRFPELYRELATRGARILTVPSAFTKATVEAGHWEVLLRARAIEDQCFVVAANQVGEHAPGIASGGESMIVDPWGEVLDRAPGTESFVLADLDLGRQEEIRRTLPSLANRRMGALA